MYKTEQEYFWEGEFGRNYIKRNCGASLLSSNIAFMSKVLNWGGGDEIGSVIEFGANIGLNLKAMQILYPDIICSAIEINREAVEELKKVVDPSHIYSGSILDFPVKQQYDLVLTKTVLIHINPNELPLVYGKLYQSARRYICVAEYYNPVPVAIPYRGEVNKLFKRDFAGELLERYPDLKLVRYGFVYHRDGSFPQDDITWFLLEKVNGPL